jgi:hypothetical protein
MKQYSDLPEKDLHFHTAQYLNSHPDYVLATPPYYSEAFKKDIIGLRNKLIGLKPSQVGTLVADADRRYGEDSRQS